jgi:hypothetical protein
MFCVSKDSRDHGVESYKTLVMPMYAEMDPAPKTSLVHFQAGIHSYWNELEDLPIGIAPSVAKLWHEAVTGGYFLAE